MQSNPVQQQRQSISGVTPRDHSLPHAEYVRVLRSRLPTEAFDAAPHKLWIIAAHLAVIGVAYLGIRFSSHMPMYLALSILIGHSLTCIAFLAHELSHKAIVRKRSVRYPLEVLLWGLNAIPATMWQRVHNHAHHIHGSTLRDPDRYFLKSEVQPPGNLLRRWYSQLFFPHHATPVWNPLVWIHFVTYIARNLAAIAYPGDRRPSIVTNKPAYANSHRLRVLFELLCIAGIQYAIFVTVGSDWEAFLWASPVALLFTSAFVMAYIWTNHYLHGLYEVHDPVASSTSVIVYPIFDRLHSNFSWHTEHHVFPGINSDFYPQVGELLRQAFPDRYHRIPIRLAWQQLFSNEPHIE